MANPFRYGQARPLALPALPAGDAVAGIAAALSNDGLAVTDDVARVVATADGHPQRTMLLAHHLYDVLASHDAAGDRAGAALERALEEVDDALQAVWDGLERPERVVVVALAEGRAATGTRVAREHGTARSTLQKALERLAAAEQHVVRRGGRPTLLDPLFAEWLRRR